MEDKIKKDQFHDMNASCDDATLTNEQKEILGCNSSEPPMQNFINVMNVVISLSGVIAVVVIVIAGITYSTAMGDAGKLAKAKKMLLYAIVGLVVVLLAFTIVNFVLDSGVLD